MSLEIAIQENTNVLKQLIAVLQSGATMPSAAAPAEDKPRRGRPPKSAAAEEKTEQVAEVVETPTAAPVAESKPVAEPPAQATAAEPEGTHTPEPKAADVPFGDVTKKIIELNRSTAPGHGRDGVLSVLQQFLGTTEGKKVPDLEALGKNAEILAFVESKLSAGGTDDLGI